jgi:hypothetical protein
MRILAGIGALTVIVAVGAAIFFFGGFFSVAASEPDLYSSTRSSLQSRTKASNDDELVTSTAPLPIRLSIERKP